MMNTSAHSVNNIEMTHHLDQLYTLPRAFDQTMRHLNVEKKQC